MFLGFQENKIKYYVEQPLNPSIYNVDRWEETNEEYVLDGDEYVLKNEEWAERQAQKEKERIAKEKAALMATESENTTEKGS